MLLQLNLIQIKIYKSVMFLPTISVNLNIIIIIHWSIKIKY